MKHSTAVVGVMHCYVDDFHGQHYAPCSINSGKKYDNYEKECIFEKSSTVQVFKADKKLFLKNELKSWFGVLLLTVVLYWGFQQFSSITPDKLIGVLVGILLLKMGGALTQYRVAEIHVNSQGNELTFVLNSMMSGKKIKWYELSEATSALINNSGLKTYVYSPVTLQIFLNSEGAFKITNRYGFSPETLALVGKAVNSGIMH